MKAGINFRIYGDYYKHVIYNGWTDDYGLLEDYSKALQILNDEVKGLVDSGKLLIKYGNKKVTIELPITNNNVGNILSCEDDYDEECWEDVAIGFEIDGVSDEEFDSNKLDIKEMPTTFEPLAIMV